ncbi:ATP-binding protein [Nocardia sp. NPDC051900]|uniref:ATP-binding protein n=1 Tax=Nocardia sp. NPDC051900 TaxID=3364326 RepID=UPI0037A82C78
MTEILIHWHAGRSQSQIASSLGLDRKTVKKYVDPAVAAGLSPGGPGLSSDEWAQLVREWFPHLADTRLRQVTWPEIEKYREFIVAMLKAGVSKQTIWQRLRDEEGLVASSASLKRYIAANLPEEDQRERVTVLRDDPPPGAEAQIDYGYLGSWVDPIGGRKRRIWAFVMVLAMSRMMFVRPVVTMDQRAWTECHVEAFAFFGGVPARLVPDNLRTGVARPDLGPVGVGKTHVAQGLGHLAIRQGAEVRFMKTSRLLATLAGGHADRTWDRRLREFIRPAVLILDDFGMRELTATQADDLYELISERAAAGGSMVLTSNRSPVDWYPLFPNPVVAESLLDRLINTSHQVFMNGPSYRPNKRPATTGQPPKEAIG